MINSLKVDDFCAILIKYPIDLQETIKMVKRKFLKYKDIIKQLQIKGKKNHVNLKEINEYKNTRSYLKKLNYLSLEHYTEAEKNEKENNKEFILGDDAKKSFNHRNSEKTDIFNGVFSAPKRASKIANIKKKDKRLFGDVIIEENSNSEKEEEDEYNENEKEEENEVNNNKNENRENSVLLLKSLNNKLGRNLEKEQEQEQVQKQENDNDYVFNTLNKNDTFNNPYKKISQLNYINSSKNLQDTIPLKSRMENQESLLTSPNKMPPTPLLSINLRELKYKSIVLMKFNEENEDNFSSNKFLIPNSFECSKSNKSFKTNKSKSNNYKIFNFSHKRSSSVIFSDEKTNLNLKSTILSQMSLLKSKLHSKIKENKEEINKEKEEIIEIELSCNKKFWRSKSLDLIYSNLNFNHRNTNNLINLNKPNSRNNNQNAFSMMNYSNQSQSPNNFNLNLDTANLKKRVITFSLASPINNIKDNS